MIQLYRDIVSYQNPLDKAIADCTDTLRTRTNNVEGASERFRKALDDLHDLENFATIVETHLKNSTFHNLPPVRHLGRPRPGLHALTCGPFRGIFLVDRSGDAVVALVFSRRPHDFRNRLDELLGTYRKEESGEG